MEKLIHPKKALFAGEKAFPVLSACEHFAGSRKLIDKALALQIEYGPIFDITADCEDGARAGEEVAHAEMVAELVASAQNVHKKIGARIHDPSHASCKEDVDILLSKCGREIAYITIPKATSYEQVAGHRCLYPGDGQASPPRPRHPAAHPNRNPWCAARRGSDRDHSQS
ncbi:hypothetical protein [Cupriavidus sp. D39]|uniref:hypothetical protein n=1 Tax=Cupriavidus sp. D39 TaxID=2997877 RepID=UPI003B637DE3